MRGGAIDCEFMDGVFICCGIADEPANEELAFDRLSDRDIEGELMERELLID